MWQAKIETPQTASVGELRRWLSDFGDKNRQHYETNLVEKKSQPGNIRRKIQVLERGISTSYSSSSVSANSSSSSSSSSSTTTSSSSSGSVGSVNNNSQSQKETSNDRLFLQAPAPSPVFRDFDSDVIKPVEKMGEMGGQDEFQKGEATLSSQELEHYRVSAIGENHQSLTKKTLKKNETRFVYPEDIDEYSYHNFWVDPESWNDPKGLLFPNVSTGTTTTTTSASSSYALNDGALDTLSLRTGRSDPGNFSLTRKLVRRITPSRSKDDSDVIINKKKTTNKKSKISLLLCKCVKDDDNENDDYYYDDDSEIEMVLHDFASLAADNICPSSSSTTNFNMMNSSAFKEDHVFSDDQHHQGSSLGEDAVTTTEEDSSGLVPSILPGAIDCRLSHVFAEETSLMNQKENQVTVDNVIRRFGGVAKRNAIQRRKEQLEKKWAENRPPAHVRKVKWQPCCSSGTYKKKVTLHYSK